MRQTKGPFQNKGKKGNPLNVNILKYKVNRFHILLCGIFDLAFCVTTLAITTSKKASSAFEKHSRKLVCFDILYFLFF